MKYLILPFALFPFIFAFAAYQWPVVLLSFKPLEFLSFFGAYVSYIGFFFSLYALLEVKKLSARYFMKQRLPEIKKQLEKIVKSMNDDPNAKLVSIRSERFLGEIAVVLRQVRKIKESGFVDVIDRAEKHHSNIENLLKEKTRMDESEDDEAEYWHLYRTLTELTDEIDAHNKGAQASL